MNQSTRSKLIELNKRFYQSVNLDFSRTRQQPWSGWGRVVDSLGDQPRPVKGISVLDLGCGNGRFGKYLIRKGIKIDHYVGIDTDEGLLNLAGQDLKGGDRVTLIKADIDELRQDNFSSLNEFSFNLIGLYGIMHHIPGKIERHQLVNKLVHLLSPDGLLSISFWQYHLDQRFANKKMDAKISGIHLDELDSNDYIINWNNKAELLRYVHVFDTQEIDSYLETESSMQLVAAYQDDGKTSNLNQYRLWKKI